MKMRAGFEDYQNKGITVCANLQCKNILFTNKDKEEAVSHYYGSTDNDNVLKSNSGSPCGLVVTCTTCNKKTLLCLHCDYATSSNWNKKNYYLNRHIPEVHNNFIDENLFDDQGRGGTDHDYEVNMSSEILNMSIDDDDEEVGIVTDDDKSVEIPSFDYADFYTNEDYDSDDDSVVQDSEQQPAVINAAPPGFRNTNELLGKFEQVFGDRESALFFCQNHQTPQESDNHIRNKQIPGGIRGLVYRSLTQPFFSHRMSDSVTSGFYFDALLKLNNDASADDKEATLRLIRGQLKMTLPLIKEEEEVPKMPLYMKDARKVILSGKFSMRENIPVEGLVEVDNMHACSSIERVIDLMMAYGTRPDFIQNEFGVRDRSGINGTAAADGICNELRDNAASLGINPGEVAIGWITVWSGEFIILFIFLSEGVIKESYFLS